MKFTTSISLLFLLFTLSNFNLTAQWTNIGPSPTSGLTSLYFDESTNNLFVGTFEGFHYYSLASSTWTSREDVGWIGRTVWTIISHPTIPGRIITGRQNAFFKGYMEISNDWGATNSVTYNSDGGAVTDVKNIPGNANKFFACTWNDISPGELIKSTDGGQSWTLFTNYLHYNITEIAPHPTDTNTIYVSGDALVTKTTDGGITWDSVDTGLPQMLGVYSVSINPATPEILICSNDNGIYRTTDAGDSWTQVDNYVCQHFEHNPVNPNIIVATTFDPYTIIISYDAGASWSDYSNGYPGPDTKDLAFSDDGLKLFIASQSGGVFIYPFNPVPVELISFTVELNANTVLLNWQTATEINNLGFEIFRNDNMIAFIDGHGTTTETHSYSYIDKYLESGIYTYRLFQIDFDGTKTDIGVSEIDIITLPNHFALEQNYPNPFNPATTIKYSIPEASFVNLKLYDILGNEIAVLINEYKDAGSYNFKFDGSSALSGLASGTYIYRLETEKNSAVRKMILMK